MSSSLCAVLVGGRRAETAKTPGGICAGCCNYLTNTVSWGCRPMLRSVAAPRRDFTEEAAAAR
jgi:hypothetical protein